MCVEGTGLAIYYQHVHVVEGMASASQERTAMAIGALLYLPIRKWIKPGVPDVDPFETAEAAT